MGAYTNIRIKGIVDIMVAIDCENVFEEIKKDFKYSFIVNHTNDLNGIVSLNSFYQMPIVFLEKFKKNNPTASVWMYPVNHLKEDIDIEIYEGEIFCKKVRTTSEEEWQIDMDIRNCKSIVFLKHNNSLFNSIFDENSFRIFYEKKYREKYNGKNSGIY